MAKHLPGVRATKKPKMTGHGGRAWDQATLILPDGSKITAYMDFVWGERFYWPQNGRWYSAPNHYQIPGSFDFDLRHESWEVPMHDGKPNPYKLPRYVNPSR